MNLTLKAARLSAALLALSAPLTVMTSLPQPASAQEAQVDEAAVQEVQAILGEAGNLAGLSEDDLKARIKSARKLAKGDGLPDDLKNALEGFVATARQELIARQSQSGQSAPEQQSEQPAQQAEQSAQEQQPGQPAVDEAALARAQEILTKAGSLTSLSEDDIKADIKSARRLVKAGDLPEDIRGSLESYISAARQELTTRQSQVQEQPATNEQQQTEQAPAEEPSQAAEPAPAEPSAGNETLARAQEILAKAGSLTSLSEDDIKADIKSARRLVKAGGLPEEIHNGLENYISAARQELVTRQAKGQQPAAPDATAQEPAQATDQQPASDAPIDESSLAKAQSILDEGSGLASMSEDDIKDRIKQARLLSKAEGLSEDTRIALQDFVDSARRELVAREAKSQQAGEQPAVDPAVEQPQPLTVEQASPAPTPPASKAENRAVEKPDVSQAAETKAAAFLADDTSIEGMKDDALRARLEAYRELLDDGELSRETERSLRKKLKDEREILRARIAARDLAEQQAAAARQQPSEGTSSSEQGSGKSQPEVNFNGPVTIVHLDQRATREEIRFVVQDRRPISDLSEVELNRRIFIYRDLVRDERYEPDQVASFRGELAGSRRELHRRYGADKAMRRRDIERRRKRKELDIDINIDLGLGASAPPPVIWAAEEDDEEIERQLVARPRRPIDRTYEREVLFEEPEVVLTRPEVRESLPSVELDTITFGFNEAFVREEEVADLDRVGSIMERIVAAHPREVFVIEGHTDAVGSDAYNLNLSRLRAIAIKNVLLEFYNIDQQNLTTVGLGERYLKIPTPEPEQENRRGTIRRITPLVSGYDPDEPEEE